MMAWHRFNLVSNGVHGERQNLSTQDKLQYQDQNLNLRTGVSALAVQDKLQVA